MVNYRQRLQTILIATTLVVSGALAQTNLTQILDTITNPDGTPFNGTAVITWNGYSGTGSGTVSRLSTSARIYNGALSVLLVPTTTASPGTYYQVVYSSSNGVASWTETWQVPPSTTALSVAAVRQTSTQSPGGGTGGGQTGGPYATLPIAINQVTGLATSLSTINNTLTTLGNTTTSQAASISSLNSTVGGLSSTVTAQGNSLTTLSGTVGTLNTTVGGQATSITTLTSSLNDLTANVASNTSSLNTVNSNVTNLTNTVNALSTTVSTLSTTASSASFKDAEVPTGTINGSNEAFSLASTPSPAASLSLFRNGLALSQGVDYTLSGPAITFIGSSLPQTGDVLLAYYRIAGSGSPTNFTDNEIPVGTIDGTNTAFTLAATPNPANSLRLFRNGLLLAPGGDYTLSGSSIAISTAATPRPGDSLAAYYRH